MSEPKAPYGDEEAPGWNAPRMSSACLKQQHDKCSGVGVSSAGFLAFTPGKEKQPELCLEEWDCVCGCHVKLGVKF